MARPRGGDWLSDEIKARGYPVPETEEQRAWVVALFFVRLLTPLLTLSRLKRGRFSFLPQRF